MKYFEYGAIVFLIAVSVIISLAYPLLTYSVGLACFGLAHVVRELFYIDNRFSARIGKKFALTLGILLFAIFLARSAIVFSWAPAPNMQKFELALVFLLALSSQIFVPSARFSSRLISGLAPFMLGLGFIASPIATLLTLSVLHNLTPVGFLVELVNPEQKRRIFLICLGVFVGIPIFMIGGLFDPIVDIIGYHNNFTIFPTGPLDRHLSVFVPRSLSSMPWAERAFGAVVFAQCMHYLAVIYILPRALRHSPPSPKRPFFPWPHACIVWLGIGALTIALVYLYFKNFFLARSLYGIAAALHAYIEIPILLWTFSSVAQVPSEKASRLVPAESSKT